MLILSIRLMILGLSLSLSLKPKGKLKQIMLITDNTYSEIDRGNCFGQGSVQIVLH